MSYSVIIDAGHGGRAVGASAFGVTAKDWNLRMSLYQYEKLKACGIDVALTRDGDETLDCITRAGKVKDRFDFCLSNHFDGSVTGERGIETIHSIHQSPNFAESLARVVSVESGLPIRGVFTREWDGRDYHFMHRLTGCTQTVILVYGFLDHKKDFNFYKKDRNFYRVADAVVGEIIRWCQ